MADKRNLLIFVLFSALILLGWDLLGPKIAPTANPPAATVKNGKVVPLPNPAASPGAPTPAARAQATEARVATPRVAIITPRLAGSIDLRGAKLDDLVLTTYRETLARNSRPIRLLSPSGTPNAYFAQIGWIGDAKLVPQPDTVWAADGDRLAPGHPVTLSWANGQGQRFVIRLSVDDKYLFTVEQGVQNGGPAPVQLRPFTLVQRTGLPTDVSTWSAHVGPVGVFDGAANYNVGYQQLDGQTPSFLARLFGNDATPGANAFQTTGGWLGFGDKYWLTALVPPAGQHVDAKFSATGPQTYQADYAAPAQTIAPNQTVTTTSRFFAGAKETTTLDAYAKNPGIQLFDHAIDWGWFIWFEKPLFYLLDSLFKLVGNFGVAIILLTILVRGLMFPLAQKQYRSMAGMRVLQPKVKALQERHKDDKPRLQQEMMKLYAEEKVNPLAGCLPTLVQVPIFYALYKVLILSIEMRHQPFVFWIRDLSAPDPLTPVNLFGLLPYTPTGYFHLGVLALILGCTSFVQFRLNPQPMDDAQKQVFALMPWMLMFIMSPFAAGLQIYWITTNLLVIAQQKLLMRRYGVSRVQPT